MRTNHGWIVIEKNPGYKDVIKVECNCFSQTIGYGESGAAKAVEWWDNKLGKPIKLEALGAFGYRVYTEE